MISRRQLIGSGIAVSALGFGGRTLGATELPFPGAARVAHLIVDIRFVEALEIAHRAAHPGTRIMPLPRDVLELWYDTLAPTPARAPQAFAGVTSEHGFFTLRTLAADHRMRVLYINGHAVQRGGEPLVSWVIGPAASRG